MRPAGIGQRQREGAGAGCATDATGAAALGFGRVRVLRLGLLFAPWLRVAANGEAFGHLHGRAVDEGCGRGGRNDRGGCGRTVAGMGDGVARQSDCGGDPEGRRYNYLRQKRRAPHWFQPTINDARSQ